MLHCKVPRLDAVGGDRESEFFFSPPQENRAGYDAVDRPEHYNTGAIEAIDAIEASMAPEEFKGYLKGNALKYLWRYRYKGKPLEDLQKAQWYLDRLVQALTK